MDNPTALKRWLAAVRVVTGGVLPQLTKEAMHVAISMANGCDY